MRILSLVLLSPLLLTACPEDKPATEETGLGDTGSPDTGSSDTDNPEEGDAQVAFTLLYSHGVAPFHATFQDLSEAADGQQIVSWSWDFGDGETSAEQNPVHRYADAGVYTVTLQVTTDGGGSFSGTETDAVLVDEAFTEPWWWHHYHADSRNSDNIADLDGPDSLKVDWTWPDRDNPQVPPVAAFNGAALSSGQDTLYITSSWDDGDNFHAIDTSTGSEAWSHDLSPWATWSSALVDDEDVVYVADEMYTVALRPPDTDLGETEPTLLWREEHDHVSMSAGFTPWGEVFEVTLSGEISIYQRREEVPDEGTLLARDDFATEGVLPLPPGVGLPLTVQQELAQSDACVSLDDGTGTAFRVPGQVADLWANMEQEEILSDEEEGLIPAFLDTCFGGIFVSNTPSVVQLLDPETGEPSEHLARIFVASVGEFHPAFEDEEALAPWLADDYAMIKAVFSVDEDYDDGELEALVTSLLPVEMDPSGRYAVNPDPDFACSDGTSPYHYPMFGTPSGEAPMDPAALPQSTLEEKIARTKAIRRMREDFYKLTRGYYTGYLQVADWNRTTRELQVRDPIYMDSPSGTSAAVSPADARSDGQQFLFLASGDELLAFDIGDTETMVPNDPEWTWDAGLPVGGSPTVFLPEHVGLDTGSGPAIAVLAGFSGLVMIHDRSLDGLEAEEVWTANPLPFDGREFGLLDSREERYYDGDWVTLAVATSVAEASDEHIYIAFTSGLGQKDYFTAHQIGTWDGMVPLQSSYTMVRISDGEIVDEEDIDEAPVCDSTIGDDERVYAIHTSGIQQIKHAMYPALFDAPIGGIVAFEEGRF